MSNSSHYFIHCFISVMFGCVNFACSCYAPLFPFSKCHCNPSSFPPFHNGYANGVMLMVYCVSLCVCVCILCHLPLCTICMIHILVRVCAPPRPVRVCVFMCVYPPSLAVKQPSLSPAPVRSQKKLETPSRPQHRSGSGKEPQCAPG